jgi:hypothetical protein
LTCEVSSVTHHIGSDTVGLVKTIALLWLPIVAGCGRLQFDPSTPDVGPAAALDHLTCGAPARFSVGAAPARLGALATPQGYNVFLADGAGNVHGFTYEFEAGTLVPRLEDVPLTSNANGPIAAIALGDQRLLAVSYGRPSATGTQLVPLDAQLVLRGQPVQQEGWFGGASTIATTRNGAIALLGQLGAKEVDAKLVSPLGTDLGAAHPLIDKADAAGQPTILPVATGFLVAWAASAPSPDQIRAEILDEQFAITTPATPISTGTQFDAVLPRVGYSAASDSYVFAWVEKTSTGDQIGISVRDGHLQETQHVMIGPGYAPAVVGGDTDFLIVWQNGTQLAAARITPSGKFTLLSIMGSSTGKFAAWDLVVRNGQPAVAWVETGGAGANLRLDPLCN